MSDVIRLLRELRGIVPDLLCVRINSLRISEAPSSRVPIVDDGVPGELGLLLPASNTGAVSISIGQFLRIGEV